VPNVKCVFSASLTDGESIRRTTEAYTNLPDTTTLAQAATALDNWLTALDAVSDAAILHSRLTIHPTLPTGLKTATGTAWAASNCNKVGLLRFTSSGTSDSWSNIVPALAASSKVAGKVTSTGASMGTYTALFTTTANNYTNPDSQQILALVFTAITDRTSRKQSINKSGTTF
jgi:hypothetical protein